MFIQKVVTQLKRGFREPHFSNRTEGKEWDLPETPSWNVRRSQGPTRGGPSGCAAAGGHTVSPMLGLTWPHRQLAERGRGIPTARSVLPTMREERADRLTSVSSPHRVLSGLCETTAGDRSPPCFQAECSQRRALSLGIREVASCWPGGLWQAQEVLLPARVPLCSPCRHTPPHSPPQCPGRTAQGLRWAGEETCGGAPCGGAGTMDRSPSGNIVTAGFVTQGWKALPNLRSDSAFH